MTSKTATAAMLPTTTPATFGGVSIARGSLDSLFESLVELVSLESGVFGAPIAPAPPTKPTVSVALGDASSEAGV